MIVAVIASSASRSIVVATIISAVAAVPVAIASATDSGLLNGFRRLVKYIEDEGAEFAGARNYRNRDQRNDQARSA